MSRTTARKRLGAAALATMAIAFVVSPAGATPPEPAGECPPSQRDLVAAVWMDRDLDVTDLLADRHWDHLDVEFAFEFEFKPDAATASRPSHPATAAIDILVDLARLPAKASLVVQHLLGAFAKVAPRVVGAFF